MNVNSVKTDERVCYFILHVLYIPCTRRSAVAVIADRTAYDDVYSVIANYQTGFGYKLTNGWYARSDSTGRAYERTQTLIYSSVTDQSSRSQNVIRPVHAWLSVSKTHVRIFFHFFRCVLWLHDTSYSKVSERTNGNLPVRNTLVQLLALYTNIESHNTQRYRQTVERHDDANSRLYCAAVRSAKNAASQTFHELAAQMTAFCDRIHHSHIGFLNLRRVRKISSLIC